MTVERERVWGAMPAAAAYWTAVGALLYAGLSRTAGRLVYPLDDTYVHMAMAKNMAWHGVWGVTSEHFTSASSSPLWTGLLAISYAIAGVSDWTPLVLNLAAGTAVVFSIHRLLREAGLAPLAASVASIALVFLGTLPTLTVLGMEHSLHVLITLWFVWLGVRLAATRDHALRPLLIVVALGAALTLTRYEGAFAVMCVTGVLVLAGRWRAAVAVAVIGALPIVVYGLWSQAQGGFLLPNSVLLKAATPPLTAVGLVQLFAFWPALTSLAVNPHLAFLLLTVLALALAAHRQSSSPERIYLALVFAASTLLHMQFARAGWFYRYETYLVVLGLVTASMLIADQEWSRPRAGRAPLAPVLAMLMLAGVVSFPMVRRAVNALRQTPVAVSNIFEQQVQAGLFLGEFYQGRRVAVNDVGAIGYLADVRLLDVWGLASADTASLKRSGTFTTSALAALATRDDAEIAIIYPSWLGEYGGVPAAWQKVGEWRVTDNVVLGENGMSFYAITAEARDRLIANLTSYSSKLPAAVVQEGVYLAHR